MPGNNFLIEPETRPVTLFAIAVTGVLASAFLGGSTNAINGLVSPRYFVTIMGWNDVTDVWRASIAQGLFEGFCFGLFFTLLFTVGTGIITGAQTRPAQTMFSPGDHLGEPGQSGQRPCPRPGQEFVPVTFRLPR